MGGGIRCGHLRGSISAFNRKPEHRCTHTKVISKLKNPITMVDLGIVYYKNTEGSWICGTLWHLYNKIASHLSETREDRQTSFHEWQSILPKNLGFWMKHQRIIAHQLIALVDPG